MKTYKEDERLKFSDIRELALKEGVEDNKVSIGIWAKQNGYKKKQSKDKNRRNYVYYSKLC